MLKSRKLTETDWLACLADPVSTLEVDLYRHPFRFRALPSWTTRRRRLQQHLLYMIAEGSCAADLDGQRSVISAGQYCWVNPEVPFCLDVRSLDDLPTAYRFRFSLERRGVSYLLPWKHRVGRSSPEFLEWARALVAEAERPGPYAMARIKSFAALLSVHAFEEGHLEESNEPSKLPRQVCDKLVRIVTEHPERRFSPAELAAECGFSHDYFSRLFRNTFDTSPKQWLVKQRLRAAAGLLAESDSRISEVAERLGYGDLYLFSRQFRAEFGVSATEWRQSHATPAKQFPARSVLSQSELLDPK